jgi:hypothetical protein
MVFHDATSDRLTDVFTLFLPGIETASADALPRLAALERLLARGRARRLDTSPWHYLAELAGGDPGRWPVGPVSALGELGTPPRACLRVEPLGAQPDQQAVCWLPAAGLDISPAEADALAAAFDETFAADGLRLEVAVPERWYLAWEDEEALDWRGFPGPAQSVAEGSRPAPPEASLRRLLSEVELLFFAHPVNTARRESGAPLIAGLHAWGGGAIHEACARPVAKGVVEEPYLAGLRRLGAIPGEAVACARAVPAANGEIAWPLILETLQVGKMATLDEDWAAPLHRMLLRGRIEGVRIVTGRGVHWTGRADALRIWRRPRPVGDLV